MSFGSFLFSFVLIRFVIGEGFPILLSFTLLIKTFLFLIKLKIKVLDNNNLSILTI